MEVLKILLIFIFASRSLAYPVGDEDISFGGPIILKRPDEEFDLERHLAQLTSEAGEDVSHANSVTRSGFYRGSWFYYQEPKFHKTTKMALWLAM